MLLQQVLAAALFLAILATTHTVVLPQFEARSIIFLLLGIEAVLTAVTVAFHLKTSLADTTDPEVALDVSYAPLYCDVCQVRSYAVIA
jgi:NADH:ubiquinone oxidoreductase subunit K